MVDAVAVRVHGCQDVAPMACGHTVTYTHLVAKQKKIYVSSSSSFHSSPRCQANGPGVQTVIVFLLNLFLNLLGLQQLTRLFPLFFEK